MKRTAQIALALLLLIVAAACHRYNRDAQLKALDEAYQSGVFTKEEYDAKKQAIVGSAVAAAPVAPAQPAAAPSVVQPAGPPAEPVAAPVPAAAPAPAPAPVQAVPPVPSSSTVPPPAAPPAAPATAAPAPAAPPADAPEPAPLAGCQDAESRAGGPGGVQERFFPASEDAVRQAALQAFATLDFTIHSNTGGEIEASKRGRLNAVVGAGAERVILHFSSLRKGGQDGTKVTGETKKGIVGRVTQKPWTGAVLAQIGCNLGSAR